MDYKEILPIIKRLEDNNISYSLGGSGLLYYLKLIDIVNDWDLAVECPKDLLLKAIAGYDWIEQSSGDFPFASNYRISINSLKIDIIGYFALQTEGGVLNLPVSHFDKWDRIKISSPEIWYVAYSLMNRKTKAGLLLNYLKNNKSKVNRNIIVDFINTKSLNDEIREELKKLIL